MDFGEARYPCEPAWVDLTGQASSLRSLPEQRHLHVPVIHGKRSPIVQLVSDVTGTD